MATMTVRKIDDSDYARFIAFARSNNRSAAAEIREFIANAGKVADRPISSARCAMKNDCCRCQPCCKMDHR
jgi:plasmid stability protein